MRQAFLTPMFLVLTIPAYGQTPAADVQLPSARRVRYRVEQDTTWRTSRVAYVGNCVTVVDVQDSIMIAAGGFKTLSLQSVTQLQAEMRDSTGWRWVAVPESQLTALRSCKVGP